MEIKKNFDIAPGFCNGHIKNFDIAPGFCHGDIKETLISSQVKTALVNKDLKKAGEMEIKKLDQLLSQVVHLFVFCLFVFRRFNDDLMTELAE